MLLVPVARVERRYALDRADLSTVLAPRTMLVLERDAGDGHYELVEGPMREYERRVVVEPAADGFVTVTETVAFRLAIPYFAWLFVPFFKGGLTGPERQKAPWWHPPQRLDARASTALGTLGVVAIVFGYLNTVFGQTVAFAADEFGASNSAQGVAGAAVRFGGLLALVIVSAADRRGRREVVLRTTTWGCVLVATGAFAPSLVWLAGSQTLARAFATALLIVAGIVAAEEMPSRARAYAVSLLGMASALGVGICVLALRLADIDEKGWRLLYLLPLLALLLMRGIGRNLPETRRFARPHTEAAVRGHGRRLWLLAASYLLLNLYVAPSTQFFNRYLKHERHYSGGAIGILSVGTGTPGAVGLVVGGRMADVRGRRLVLAISLFAGTALDVATFFTVGGTLWAWAILSAIIGDASIPALLVYGPELFPTSLRGRANGVIGVVGLVGSGIGLLAAGAMADGLGRIGPAMAVLSMGPLLLVALVLVGYPETAGLELEQINPEDEAPD